MLFNVPQFINVEDKIVGPFTGKQLLWLAGLGAVLLVLWNVLEKAVFIVAAIPISLIFLAFTFYRPYNQSLVKFVAAGIMFLFRPKTYVWERKTLKVKVLPVKKNKQDSEMNKNKVITPEEIKELAETLDSRGGEK
ncbi:PrgI family protein [bacterium]|nr:PrgI family protein [bacterium]